MNLAAARAELQARGFNFETDSRLNTYLNEAQHEFNEFASWPWLETTTTGNAPLLIADLRDVLWVVDTDADVELQNEDVRDITDVDPASQANTGTPTYYWLDNLTLNVWPLNTSDNLKVRYLRVAPDLTGDTDTPLFPARYHNTIWITLAQVRLLGLDNSTDSLAGTLRQQVVQDMQQAANNLLNRMYDAPQVQVMNDDPDSSIWRGGMA